MLKFFYLRPNTTSHNPVREKNEILLWNWSRRPRPLSRRALSSLYEFNQVKDIWHISEKKWFIVVKTQKFNPFWLMQTWLRTITALEQLETNQLISWQQSSPYFLSKISRICIICRNGIVEERMFASRQYKRSNWLQRISFFMRFFLCNSNITLFSKSGDDDKNLTHNLFKMAFFFLTYLNNKFEFGKGKFQLYDGNFSLRSSNYNFKEQWSRYMRKR